MISAYFEAWNENGRVCGVCRRHGAGIPEPAPEDLLLRPMWLVGKKRNEGDAAFPAAKNHFSIHVSDEDFAARLGAELPLFRAGKRCVSIKYGDKQAFGALREKVKAFPAALC